MVSYDPLETGLVAAERALARLSRNDRPEPFRTIEIPTSVAARRTHLGLS